MFPLGHVGIGTHLIPRRLRDGLPRATFEKVAAWKSDFTTVSSAPVPELAAPDTLPGFDFDGVFTGSEAKEILIGWWSGGL